MHGFSLEQLEAEGVPPAQVIAEMNMLFADEVLLSDAPQFEWGWLCLLDDNSQARFTLSTMNVSHVLSTAAAHAGVDAETLKFINGLRAAAATHNALADAASWLAAAEAISSWYTKTTQAQIEAVFAGWRDRVGVALAAGKAAPESQDAERPSSGSFR
jgi:hypothetical protein